MKEGCNHGEFLVAWDGHSYIYICKNCQKEFLKKEENLEEMSDKLLSCVDSMGRVKRKSLSL